MTEIEKLARIEDLSGRQKGIAQTIDRAMLNLADQSDFRAMREATEANAKRMRAAQEATCALNDIGKENNEILKAISDRFGAANAETSRLSRIALMVGVLTLIVSLCGVLMQFFTLSR